MKNETCKRRWTSLWEFTFFEIIAFFNFWSPQGNIYPTDLNTLFYYNFSFLKEERKWRTGFINSNCLKVKKSYKVQMCCLFLEKFNHSSKRKQFKYWNERNIHCLTIKFQSRFCQVWIVARSFEVSPIIWQSCFRHLQVLFIITKNCYNKINFKPPEIHTSPSRKIKALLPYLA